MTIPLKRATSSACRLCDSSTSRSPETELELLYLTDPGRGRSDPADRLFGAKNCAFAAPLVLAARMRQRALTTSLCAVDTPP